VGRTISPADRGAAEQVVAVMPSMPLLAKAGRRFLVDAVHELAEGQGIRQFLDIGTGLPTAGNTHEIAQQVAPESRIVYVDHDPLVISHAQALLTSSPHGKTDFLQADLRDPEAIVAGAAATLDFARPVGVLLIAVLHFIPDADDPYRIVH
jgi:trans-aconitate methyltransferase